jgi:hypothetical protein
MSQGCVAALTWSNGTLNGQLPGDNAMIASASKQAAPDASTGLPPDQTDHSVPAAAQIDPAQRHQMISEAAFFIAQARGFTPCQELDDWCAAEREIEQRLSNPDH